VQAAFFPTIPRQQCLVVVAEGKMSGGQFRRFGRRILPITECFDVTFVTPRFQRDKLHDSNVCIKSKI